MRHRPLSDPSSALATVSDCRAGPGDELSLADDLLDAGVPRESLPHVVVVLRYHSTQLAAEFVRRLLLSLEKTPAAAVLQRAILGADGRSLADDAAEVGVSKQALAAAENRLKARLEKRPLTTVPKV